MTNSFVDGDGLTLRLGDAALLARYGPVAYFDVTAMQERYGKKSGKHIHVIIGDIS